MLIDQQDAEAFRQELRQWLAANCPAEMRDGARDETAACWGGRNWQFTCDAQKTWLERMIAQGLTTPTWPREYGGGGLERAREKVFFEEMAAIGARLPLVSFGIWMLGPALLKFGTEEQKQTYLPPIVRGEIRWCQGYSEPGAGSDLASVATRAEDRGDHYLVNGQKIWTSYADKADWIFALVRTDGEAPKHKGISFLLIDMQTEGVSTRPIRLISGASVFCETFFDDVRVAKSNVVGAVNQGWDIAKYLLTHEREMISAGAAGLTGGRSIAEVLASQDGKLTDATRRARALECEIDGLAFGLTLERYKDQAAAGQAVGDASAMLKYMGCALNQRRHDLLMDMAGMDALAWDGDHDSLPADWLRSKANSIEGGTSEVMLGIIAKRVLGLPG